MTHDEAVQVKKQKQKVTGTEQRNIFTSPTSHAFKQKVIIQKDYEQKSFLGFNYKKLVGKKIIPIALCEICNKLEVEHNA